METIFFCTEIIIIIRGRPLVPWPVRIGCNATHCGRHGNARGGGGGERAHRSGPISLLVLINSSVKWLSVFISATLPSCRHLSNLARFSPPSLSVCPPPPLPPTALPTPLKRRETAVAAAQVLLLEFPLLHAAHGGPKYRIGATGRMAAATHVGLSSLQPCFFYQIQPRSSSLNTNNAS